MMIPIVQGAGIGQTKLSAFDAALHEAGISNHNLLYLSSVIPPKAEIKPNSPKETVPAGEWGDKLYVVIAQESTDQPGVEAWAGVGWVQEQESGKGLFVEHHGESKEQVEQLIAASLNDLMATRQVDFGEINMQVVGITCEDRPVCALVAAVYQSETWR